MKRLDIHFKLALFLVVIINIYSCKQSSNTTALTIENLDAIEERYTPKVVEVTLGPESFSAPDTLLAGYITIRYNNKTDEMHSAHLIKLDDGHSSEELIKAYKETSLSGSPRPDWMTHIGGVISGPGTSEASLPLAPGQYTWVCVMGSDEAPHFEGLESQSLVVRGTLDDSISLKEADAIVNMTDSIHLIQGSLNPGRRIIDINNVGTGYHLLAISKLNDGANANDLTEWFKTYQGPPPATNIISTSAIGPGLSARIEPEFEKGTYVFYCMANAEGTYHLFDGAITTLSIKD